MEDPTVALSRMLAAISSKSAGAEQRAVRGERMRRTLLYVHASAGLFIAPLFLHWASRPAALASPTWAVARNIPAAPVTLSVLLFTGATVLLMGTASGQLRFAQYGLLLVFGFYALLALTFAAAVVVWVAAGADPRAEPAVYAPFVYAHLAAIMLVHALTIRALLRVTR